MRPVWIFRHTADESPGTLAEALDAAGLPWRLVDLWHALPERFVPEELAGLVVLGGPMNADQTLEYPFLAPEVGWIAAAVAAQTPVLGVCLGAQLLAQALGGRVYHHAHKEIGWYDIHWTAAADDDPLWRGLPQSSRLFEWHGDTFDLPAGAVHLAASTTCAAQAFRYGQRAYGLQFHLEVTEPIIERWLDEPAGREELAALDYIDVAEVRRQTCLHSAAMRQLAAAVFGRFAALCKGNRASGAEDSR